MNQNSDDRRSIRQDAEADDVFGDVNTLLGLLKALDERGLILSLSAFSEDCLGRIILQFLSPIKESSQLVDDFSAPLGTFSARLKASLALGLVTRRQYDDLDRLRKIRNLIAHTWEPISLEDQRIASHIDAISFDFHQQSPPSSHREKLSTTFAFLLIELKATQKQISSKRLGARPIARHLIAGFSGDTSSQISQAQTEINDLHRRIIDAKGSDFRFLEERKQHIANRIVYIVIGSPPSEREAAIRSCIELFDSLGVLPGKEYIGNIEGLNG